MKHINWIACLGICAVAASGVWGQPPVPAPGKKLAGLLRGPVAARSDAQATSAEPAPVSDPIPSKVAGFLQAPIVTFDPPAGSHRSGVAAGGTFYFLKPYMQNNTAFVTTINPGLPNAQVISDSLNWNFQPTFAGWIGWTGTSGIGVRARYFQFDASSNTTALTNGATPAPQTQTTINPPLANFLPLSTGGTAFGSPSTTLNSGFGVDQMTVGSDLRIHAIDLEATYAWRVARWSFLAFGGGRYLDMLQGYQATLANNGGGAGISETQSFVATRSFSGGGPTLGLQGNLHTRLTGLSLFAIGRGAMLVGTMRENVAFAQLVNDPNGLVPGHIPPPSILAINPTGSRATDHVLPIFDVELGLEYGRFVGRTYCFFRGGVVNQTYFDAGNASQSTGNLSLFGVQASLGVNY